MTEPRFFRLEGPFTVAALAAHVGAPVPAAFAGRTLAGVAALEEAGPTDVAFVESAKHHAKLSQTAAGAVIVGERSASHVPMGTATLVVPDPARAFLSVAALFHPGVERPSGVTGQAGVSPAAHVHSTARLEADVTVEAGAVIGANAAIGTGTVIGAGAVIGAGVHVGRECSIGPTCVLQHALVGDRVILHPGVKVGQDGFGYVMGPRGHAKLPQLGRVIIQNDVEIGAGTTIDRGAFRDTVIGEGTKIDNLVQIAHNVVIGRHCVIVAQVGIAGSCVLGDFVVIGGGAGVSDHVTLGAGVQVAAKSGVMDNVPAGTRMAGLPAIEARDFFKTVVAVRKLARGPGKQGE